MSPRLTSYSARRSTFSYEKSDGKTKVTVRRVPEGICMALDDDDDSPRCIRCNIEVPGLLTLPCGCAGAVCGECFVQYGCDKFANKNAKKVAGKGKQKCPLGCVKKQEEYRDWAKKQPRLILQTDEVRAQLAPDPRPRARAQTSAHAACAGGSAREGPQGVTPQAARAAEG